LNVSNNLFKIDLTLIFVKMEDIIGYEGLYQINKEGVIINKHNRIMKSYVETDGYVRIPLTKNNKQKKYQLHRLIALQFIPNPNNYDYIDHIDNNKQNNSIENLRWINMSGNMRNRVISVNKYGLPRGVFKSGNKFRVLIKIDKVKKCFGTYDTIEEASYVYEKKYNELMNVFDCAN